jgi:O-acetyl-ADP-ribose deacetylase (regulator of RNase III)
VAKLSVKLPLAKNQTLSLYHGDLTEEKVDAIVNAANERLAHGGGLAGAMVRKGGRDIQRESDEWVRVNGRAGHDRPVLTGPGLLPCRAIIHAVGPVWGSGEEDAKLRTAYTAALRLAHAQGFTSIAFPSLSTGLFGFPVERAAPIAVQAVVDFCSAHPCAAHPDSPLRDLRFTLIDAPTVQIFQREFERRARET